MEDLTRLADILVIQAICSWIESMRKEAQGLIAALHDRQIGRAMSLNLLQLDAVNSWPKNDGKYIERHYVLVTEPTQFVGGQGDARERF